MTPRERVLTAWRGGMPDRVPVAIWHTRLFPPDYPPLLEAEVCIIVRSDVYRVEHEGVQTESKQWTDHDGNEHVRTVYHTRAGDVQTASAFWPAHATTWVTEWPFKTPDDYGPLIELVASRRFVPTYDQFVRDDARHGPQSIGRPAPLRTPMFEIMYELMGVEMFCTQLADKPDAMDALYEALLAKRREALAVVADSPAQYAVIEGNISFDIVGPQRFDRYYLPAIEEACDLLHKRGMLAAAHLDGNNRAMAGLIGRTSLDVIEAFTPPPDCDLALGEARRLWPDKAIHLNFPSSLHLRGLGAVVDAARGLLAEAVPGDRFVMGLTEDTPTNEYFVPLARVVRDEGKTPLTGAARSLGPV